MTFENMKLYMKPGCPFCMKVDRFLNEAGITIEHLWSNEGTNREDLVAIGGKAQFPCLVEDGVPMYESDDIISHLKTLL